MIEELKGYRHFGNITMEYSLIGQTMVIEVTSKEEEKIYWTTLSHDSVPQAIRVLFPDPKSIYQFFSESTESGQIIIPSMERIVLSIKIGKNIREFPIYLAIKQLTIQQKLTRKIISLQKQLKKQKQQNKQNYKLLNLQLQIQSKQLNMKQLKQTIKQLTNQNEKLRQENERKQQNQKKLLVQKISTLQRNKISLQEQINSMTGVIVSQNMIIQQLQREMKDRHYKSMNNPSPFGQLLIFQPAFSINSNCFTFKNYLLTKNNNSKDGTGRMIPSATPIPRVGRYHYKFINKNIGEHPNFRIGVISRANLTTEAYMNGGDVDAVMYYCYNTEQQIIYQGTNKMEGFSVYKGSNITVVIDQTKKQIQWYVEQLFMNTSKYTQSMKKSENLYFFIQLWHNGDSLQIVDN